MSTYNNSVFNQQVLAKAIETGSPAKHGHGNRDHHDFMGRGLVITPEFLDLDLTISGKPHQGSTWDNTLSVRERLDVLSSSNTFHFGTLKEMFIDPILADAANGDDDDQAKAVENAEKVAKEIMKDHDMTSKDELDQVFYSVKGEDLRSSDCVALNDFTYDLHDVKSSGYALLHNVHAASVVAMIVAWAGYDMARSSFQLA